MMPSSERQPRTLSGCDQLFAIRLMEHLVVPTFVLDPSGRVMIWNRACERLTGLLSAEVVGTKDHWRGFYHTPRPCLADLVLAGDPGDLPTLYADHAQPGTGQAGLSAENWCAMPRVGEIRYLAIDAGPIYTDVGELLGVVETLRDMTAHKEAQLALEKLANNDGLTGLANRRMFDRSLEQECRRARRDGNPLSVLLIDIDHFKRYNDTLGHQAGDECLKQVARLIAAEMLRPGDIAARYGGEEFVVILPATPLNGAVAVAERILAAMSATALPHPDSPIADHVTPSIGAASCAAECSGPKLVSVADSALYRAKLSGRNRVVATDWDGSGGLNEASAA